MNHEDTKSLKAATTAPLCLCGGTDLWQIYGGAKGVNPVSMLDRVCNGLGGRTGEKDIVLAVEQQTKIE